jgi:hypothetical protein
MRVEMGSGGQTRQPKDPPWANRPWRLNGQCPDSNPRAYAKLGKLISFVELLNRITDLKKRKSVKISVAGVDGLDAMLFHENGSVGVKNRTAVDYEHASRSITS